MLGKYGDGRKFCAESDVMALLISGIETWISYNRYEWSLNRIIFVPAKDFYHDIVRTALIKDGWTITDDPLILKIGKRSAFVDLGAEKLIAAERGSEKIAVEIKSFLSPSPINDIENAWGQFFMYARILQKKEPDRRLYLAISHNTFETLFQEEIGQLLSEEPGFRIIVFDSNLEEIIQWQPQINP
jgi:XisH protein